MRYYTTYYGIQSICKLTNLRELSMLYNKLNILYMLYDMKVTNESKKWQFSYYTINLTLYMLYDMKVTNESKIDM